MTKAIPTIQKYMSTAPHSIGVDQPALEAHKMMKTHKIRHLPVLNGGKLVGMLTERDLALVESFEGALTKSLSVEDAMTQEVYTVSPRAKLDEVASEMALHKYGSAVVLENNQVVGIFTAVDACKALADLLENRLHA